MQLFWSIAGCSVGKLHSRLVSTAIRPEVIVSVRVEDFNKRGRAVWSLCKVGFLPDCFSGPQIAELFSSICVDDVLATAHGESGRFDLEEWTAICEVDGPRAGQSFDPHDEVNLGCRQIVWKDG